MPFTTQYMVILDYAHTPDALEKVLTYLNEIKKNKIITVTGSAGGREKEKRPFMGKVVLDPRNEDCNTIIDDLIGDSKLNNYERIINRKEAIYQALKEAKPNDIVLIAGKGRDNYMAIGNEYQPYSDYEVIKSFYQE